MMTDLYLFIYISPPPKGYFGAVGALLELNITSKLVPNSQ